MSTKLKPGTTYAAIVGQVLARKRTALDKHQAVVAKAVKVGQSTWSRVETGKTALTVEQLRLAANALESTPEAVLAEADHVERYLRERGMRIVTPLETKQPDVALALVLGTALGLLLAAAFSRK